MNQPEPLEKIRHSMYSCAERWWWVGLACVVLGAGASTLLIKPILPPGGLPESAVLLISVLAPVLAAISRRQSSDYAGKADLCRRAFLYKDALGEELSIEEQRIVALWPANTPLNPITTAQPYFSSTRGKGAGRLAEAIGESAFYTGELARPMAVAGYFIVSTAAILLLAALSVATTLAFDTTSITKFQTAIGLIAIAVLTVITVEVLMTTLAYARLSRECKEISKSASQFLELPKQNLATALRLAESYSIVLAANLPIPNFIYRRYHDRIDRAYRQRLAGP
jgi:hypothetical protein